jgi:phage terminase small subunit
MKIKTPQGLSAEAKHLWTRTLAAWPIGKEATLLVCLRNACFSLDRLRAAEAALAKHGSGIYLDRFGLPKQHPLCLVIRDSTKQLHDALRMLSLDWEQLNRGNDEPGEDQEGD